MKSLLIATTNPSKLEEAHSVLSESGLKLLRLKDFPEVKPVPETGETFEENAVIKAKEYFSQIGIPTIADDGGLIVDALNGLPGVHSHRWLGHHATDQELANAILKALEGVPVQKRTARLGGAVAFYDGTHLLKQENYVEGYIADNLMSEIKPGFPYRPIFIIAELNKPFSTTTVEEDERIGPRRKNLRALKPKIIEYLKEK